MPISAPSVAEAGSYLVSGALALLFVLVVVLGARAACRGRTRPDDLQAVMLGFIAAGSVSALVAALL